MNIKYIVKIFITEMIYFDKDKEIIEYSFKKSSDDVEVHC